jgi:C-terminal processing protease CtpA/Prc
MPKRFKSAFLFFVADNRAKIRADNPSATFMDVGRMCGEQWKALSTAQRKKYTAKAIKDKADYSRRVEAHMRSAERKAWEVEQAAALKLEAEADAAFIRGVASAAPRSKRGFTAGYAAREPIPSRGKRVNAKRDPNMPKRPASAYNLFTSSARRAVLKQLKGRPQSEIETVLGQQWKSLSAAQRAKYQAMAESAKQGHRARLDAYLASATRKAWEQSVSTLATLPQGMASVDTVVKLSRAESSMGIVLEAYAGTGTKWSWLRGVAVVLVAKGAAADLSGVEPGHIVTHVNGTAVSDPSLAANELQRAKTAGKKTITLSLAPRSVPKKVLAKMASRALSERKQLKPMYVPVATANVPPQVTVVEGPVRKFTLQRDNQPMGLVLSDDPSGGKGAFVDSANKKSVAMAAKFKKGDVVVAINGVKVKSGGDAVKVMAALRGKGVLQYAFTMSDGGASQAKKRKAPAAVAGAASKRGRRDV